MLDQQIAVQESRGHAPGRHVQAVDPQPGHPFQDDGPFTDKDVGNDRLGNVGKIHRGRGLKEEVEAWIKAADGAVYRAKAMGGDTLVIAEPESQACGSGN